MICMQEVKISVCPVNWRYAKKTWRVDIWLQILHIDIKRRDYFRSPVYLTQWQIATVTHWIGCVVLQSWS
jgi:hypothetical protein